MSLLITHDKLLKKRKKKQTNIYCGNSLQTARRFWRKNGTEIPLLTHSVQELAESQRHAEMVLNVYANSKGSAETAVSAEPLLFAHAIYKLGRSL